MSRYSASPNMRYACPEADVLVNWSIVKKGSVHQDYLITLILLSAFGDDQTQYLETLQTLLGRIPRHMRHAAATVVPAASSTWFAHQPVQQVKCRIPSEGTRNMSQCQLQCQSPCATTPRCQCARCCPVSLSMDFSSLYSNALCLHERFWQLGQPSIKHSNSSSQEQQP